MARNRAGTRNSGDASSETLRIRAAWMYYVEQMTQSAIADVLGVGRVSVVRLLAEARERGEVRVSLTTSLADAVGLERELEQRFGLERAIVAPLSDEEVDPVPVIAAALASTITPLLEDGSVIGLGWGRTLLKSLSFMTSRSVRDLKVVSLLGGIAHVERFNPAEFVWRFAQMYNGEAYLLSAPAIVDSVETKRALIERCGLDAVMDMTNHLDTVVVGAGEVSAVSTTFRTGYLGDADRLSLLRAGAVGDVLFRYFDAAGELIDHPLNDRVVAADMERLHAAPTRILTAGGAAKADVLPAAIRFVKPTILVTDEVTARRVVTKEADEPA